MADHLFESPVLTIPQAQHLLEVTYHSARRNVEKLVKAGILQPIGEASLGRTFVAPEVLDVIGGVAQWVSVIVLLEPKVQLRMVQLYRSTIRSVLGDGYFLAPSPPLPAPLTACRVFDLWGIPDEAGSAEEDLEEVLERGGLWGVYRFKRGFGGRIVRHCPSYDYVYSPFLYWLSTRVHGQLRRSVGG